MYKLCVFDMDGTFMNSIGDIAAAMNRSLKTLNKKTYTIGDYCKMVGDGMEVLCRRALPDSDEEEIKKLITLYKNDYIKNCCVETKPYDGMTELCKKLSLSGIKTAILSNKPHEQAVEIFKTLMIYDLFDEIMGCSAAYPPKPAPDSLIAIMKKFGANEDNTIYIGDSNVDIQLAKAAGVKSVGVKWGFRTEKELRDAGADFIAGTSFELENLLLY